MKKTVSVFFSFFALLCIITPHSAQASHAAAGEIVYEHIADSTYRFYFFLYRDCTGVVEDDTALLCFKNTCNNTGFNVVINKYTGPNGTHLPPSCPKFKNNCDSPASTLPGFRQWLYTGLVTMPAQCSAWKISVYVQSRNLNMNFATSGNFYVETMMNNTGAYQGNSSPYMLTRPVPYLCISQPAIFNN